MKIKKIKVTISTTKLTCSNERRLETVAVFICFIYTHKIIYRTIELCGIQQPFKIYDEQGNLIAEDGDLELAAYESFHNEEN